MGLASFNRARREAEEKKNSQPIEEEDKKGEPNGLTEEDKKFNALIVKLDTLKDKEIEFCAKHLGFEFTTKDETIAQIKSFLHP